MCSSFKATCKFECHIHEALSAMKDEDKCLPWYYPQVDPHARLCSPFEAKEFRTKLDTMSNKKCKVSKDHVFNLLATSRVFLTYCPYFVRSLFWYLWRDS